MRAFFQDRLWHLRRQQLGEVIEGAAEKSIGKVMLFFGCRKKMSDFLYADEWMQFRDGNGEFVVVVMSASILMSLIKNPITLYCII
jgi:sulfite reductase alpha subunit-like flavoprotein